MLELIGNTPDGSRGGFSRHGQIISHHRNLTLSSDILSIQPLNFRIDVLSSPARGQIQHYKGQKEQHSCQRALIKSFLLEISVKIPK